MSVGMIRASVLFAGSYMSDVCLRILGRWIESFGEEWVVAQVDDDPGLLWIPTCDDAYPGFMIGETYD